MRAARACLAAVLCVLGAAGVVAADNQPQPHESMRALRMLQDRITRGDAAAIEELNGKLDEVGKALQAAADQAWQSQRNLRAALAYVLSGGNSAILRKLLLRGLVPATEEKLVRGVLAYATSRNPEALDGVAGVNVRTLEAGLGAQIALAQAEIAAKTDPAKALRCLDEVRLLAPGTLMEDGALRRQVALLVGLEDYARADALTEQYLRRFGRSAYAGAFRRQLARFVVLRPGPVEPARMAAFEAALQWVEPADRQDVFVAIAREGLGKGRVDFARYAVDQARALGGGRQAVFEQAGIYRAAALAASAEFEAAVAALEAARNAALDPDAAELIAAAEHVFAEVRRLPDAPAGMVEPAVLDELSGAFAQVRGAREVMAEADRLLAGAAK